MGPTCALVVSRLTVCEFDAIIDLFICSESLVTGKVLAFVYDSRCLFCCHNKLEFFPYRHCPLTHQMTHITVLVLVEVEDPVSRPYLDCPRLYNLQRSTVLFAAVG